MKINIALLIFYCFGISCNPPLENVKSNFNPLVGSWKLLTGTLTEKGESKITDYTHDQSFIKIINQTHFAFLLHDISKGKDSTKI